MARVLIGVCVAPQNDRMRWSPLIVHVMMGVVTMHFLLKQAHDFDFLHTTTTILEVQLLQVDLPQIKTQS